MFWRFFFAFLFFVGWMFWARYYYVCVVQDRCVAAKQIMDSVHVVNVPRTLGLSANGLPVLENYPQFVFDNSSAEPVFLNGQEAFLKAVAALMQKNPQAILKITGKYLATEHLATHNGEMYNDLGTARAMAIIDKMRSEYGLPEERFAQASQLMQGDTLLEPLSFELLNYFPDGYDPKLNGGDTSGLAQNKPDTNATMQEQVRTSLDNVTYVDRSTSNFASGSQDFKPTPDFKIYIDSVKSYFKRNPSDFLIIVGHTDTKGEPNYNLKLGKQRAEAVKKYLQKQGIKAQIVTESQGENQPAVSDQNPDGSYNESAMAQNRRVNLLIKSK